MEKLVVFFPDKGRGVRRVNGHILKVEGKVIEQDFTEADSRDTDDYELDVELLPTTTGIYVFEGTSDDPGEWDKPEYEGRWRKATAADLEGLIDAKVD